MIETMEYALESDIRWCHMCDGPTVRIYCDDCDTDHCETCHNAYGCEGCE